MALKKEHLSIYLPFDLEIKLKNGRIMCLGTHNYINHKGINYVLFDEDKPLFRRLSQITKPITIDGDTFIPAERIADEGYKFVKLDKKGYYYQKIADPTKGGYLNIDILNWPYKYFIRLVAMHFDVFSLIDSGDASVKK